MIMFDNLDYPNNIFGLIDHSEYATVLTKPFFLNNPD